MTDRRWLTVNQMAKRMGVSRATLYRYIAQRDQKPDIVPPPARPFGRLQWASDVVERWEEAQMRKAKAGG
jgi:predicted DNA-binding transcriptional regulator AlpA